MTLVGFRERLGPLGELVAERDTVPVKPLRLESVMVELAEEPRGAFRLLGLAEVLKSGEGGVDWWNRHPVTGWISQPLKLCHCWLI